MPLKISLGLPHDDAVERQKRDQIGERHQSVEDIRDIPYRRYSHIGADKDAAYVQIPIDLHCFFISVEQVFQAALTIIILSQNRRKREEHQADHQ